MVAINFEHNLGDSVIYKDIDNTLLIGTIIEVLKNRKGEHYLIESRTRGTNMCASIGNILCNLSELNNKILNALLTDGEVDIHIKL